MLLSGNHAPHRGLARRSRVADAEPRLSGVDDRPDEQEEVVAPDEAGRRLGLSQPAAGARREPRTAAGWTPQTPPRPTQLSPYAPQPAPVSAGPPDAPPHLQSRNPVDRLTRGLPPELRVTIDWARHDRRRHRDRPPREGVRRQPVPDPVVSMEPTLHCAAPGAAARHASPTASSRTGSSTTSATHAAARSSSSRRRPRRRSSAARAGRSSSA